MTPEKAAEIKIQRMELAAIKPHPKNPRSHPAEGSREWEILKRSLESDYFDPLVVNSRNGQIVSGHLRYKVLLSAGFTQADVSVVDYDEPTHLARLIAANNLFGEFVSEMLSAVAGEIETAGLDAALAGWDEKALAAQLDGPVVTDDTQKTGELVSQAEMLQREWQVAEGDQFEVGRHILLCGDSTDRGCWERILGGRVADLVWTDPPYNVDYDSLLNDDLPAADYREFLLSSLGSVFEFTKAGGSIYVAHADSHGLLVRQAVADAGWNITQNLIWVKNAWSLGRQDYQWQHEPILYGWKPGAAHYWQGGFSQSTVIDDEAVDLKKAKNEELIAIIQRLRNARETSVIRESRSPGSTLHPTIKPLPLVARQIWNSSRRDELVLEPFGGSGTTLAACQQTNRVCCAMELDPKFCAVILERLKEAGLPIKRNGNDIT